MIKRQLRPASLLFLTSILMVGCGGGTSTLNNNIFSNGNFTIHTRLFNAAVGGNGITLKTGISETIGTAAIGTVTGYTDVNADVVAGTVGHTSFLAYDGLLERAAIDAQVAASSQDTVVYTVPEGGQGSPALLVFPEDQNVNAQGTFRINLVNLASQLGTAVDLYILDAQGTTANQGPLFASVGLNHSSAFSVTSNVAQGSRIVITQAGNKQIVHEVPFPAQSFTASGNFSVYFTDAQAGATQIKLLNNTRP